MKIRALPIVVVLIAAGACGTVPPAPPVGVLLITLDTTRADRLSPYGFSNASMPHLDRLAREGVVFDQATSVAPLTLPAHTSLFTGLFPPRHGVRENADRPLAGGHVTLAEVLEAHGYLTAGFVGSVVLNEDRGLSQGFQTYGNVQLDARQPGLAAQRRGEAVVDDAIQWLDRLNDSRFFLWTHLYDPHRPYDPPEPFASLHASDPYVGEIAYADAQIGRLLRELERRNLLDRTIVIVTADHGESLGEHDERDHGIFVYESVLRVPLIIRAPGLTPRRVGSLVRIVDVMPTVLELVGLRATPGDGVSSVGLMAGETLMLDGYAESHYPRRFGWTPLRALRDGRFKLIDAPRAELYDLERDPFELRNIYHERRSTAAALMRQLRSVAGDSAMTPPVPEATAHVPIDLRERLAALGYAATGWSASLTTPELIDPKDGVRRGGRPWQDRVEPH